MSGRSLALLIAASFGFAMYASSDTSPVGEAVAAFKAGDYQKSIPLLASAMRTEPQNALVAADLLSALTYEGRVDEATALDDKLAASFSQSPDALAARGDFAFYLGDMATAEQRYKKALKLQETTARAYYGLYHLYRAASLHHVARMALLRAYAIDPDDAAIRQDWFAILTPAKKKELIEQFLKDHPESELDENLRRDKFNGSELAKALHGRTANELQGGLVPASVHLVYLLYGPGRIRGIGVELTLNGGKKLRLLLDTGASGIVINQRAADQVGLAHLGEHETWGIGDGGIKKSYISVADTCAIGSLTYNNCILHVMESTRSIVGDDGLIGTDFFSAFLIDLNFVQRKMTLTPLPERPPNPQGYDRTITPGFTPIFRFGHELMIPTKVNGSRSGLFLLDTGASLSNIDREFAEESMKVHHDEYMSVKGLSGKVKNVFEADTAVIQFATYRQQNLGMTVFDLNNSGKHEPVRMAGILGLPVLSLFHLTLDYRNGQVKFEYLNH